VVGGGTVLAGRLAWRARRAPSATGAGALVGRPAAIQDTDGAGNSGRVRLDGTWWRARRRDNGPLAPAQSVRIVALDGLDLVVEPCEPTHPATPTAPSKEAP